MANVICSTCGKENEPTGKWNYCRGCGGRLELPVAETTVRSAAGGDEAVTATAARPATAKKLPVAQAAPRHAATAKKLPKKTAQQITQEMRWWTFGLILGLGAIGMIIGSLLKERGVEYSLLTDPFNLGMIGGIMTGGLIAQCMLWYRQSQQ